MTMGEAQQSKKAFLEAHPRCCFCGGKKRATTQDHVPSRAFFNDRAWPEGFVFPACNKCNAASAKGELLATVLLRIGKIDATDEEKAYTRKLTNGVKNNFPGIVDAMRVSAEDQAAYLEGEGKKRFPNAETGKLIAFSLEDERCQDAVAEFGRKLLLALFYFHTHDILPREGRMAFRWFANTNLDEIHPVMETVTPKLVTTTRRNTNLGEQFYYRYGVAEGNRATAFVAFFNGAAAIMGVIFAYDPRVPAPPVGRVLTCYEWDD
jgi:hypothetical protein